MTEGFPALDFETFHREELPRRVERWGEMAVRAAEPLGSLGFRLPDGRAFTLAVRDRQLVIVPGDAEAHTVVGIDARAWEGLVHDLESAPGLLYAGRIRRLRGDLMRFVGWEPALRALFHGIPVYGPEHADLRDPEGRPLEPTRAFRWEESDEGEMATFLDAAGYLLVRGVFSPAEVAGLRAGAEELRRRAREGDRESWWGRDDRGQPVLCRVLRAGQLPIFRSLPEDARVARIAALPGCEMAHRDPESPNGITVLWKNPGVVEGLSDLPWHRDCGMGGHAVMCPTMVLSIFLEAATPASGELRFLPGSWRTTCGFAEATDPRAPRGVGVRAEAGDVTIHYGDGMHAAPPPTGREGPFRCSVLIGFARPGARHHRGEDHYNDVLLGREDGQVEHLARVAARR